MRATTAVKTRSRRESAIASARAVFLRYGFARTTMDDLARAAGMSRPALYLLFAGKEEVFAATIDDLWQETRLHYETHLSNLPTLEERLRFVLHHWTGTGYELTSTYPDAKDAFDMQYPAVRKMYGDLCDFVGHLLAGPVAKSHLRVTFQDVACATIFSLRGIKEIARDRQHMHSLIDLQVDLLLAALK